MKRHTCKDQVRGHLQDRISDLENIQPDSLSEYGLCFDYVLPDTFQNQSEGYFRYLLSTGGPGDEFRFYTNPDFSVHRIEYWFLDWFDGAGITLQGENFKLMEELWENDFQELAQYVFDKASGID